MACADSALLFLMDEAGVSSDTQKKIYQGGFDTLISFAGLDETSAGVRAALKQFGLDVETSLAIRKEVALLVGVWESAKTQRAMQVKQKLDANASGQARLIQTTEYAAMRSAVEAMQGSLRDKEAPRKSLVASKLEQLAHQLRRICGKPPPLKILQWKLAVPWWTRAPTSCGFGQAKALYNPAGQSRGATTPPSAFGSCLGICEVSAC